MNLKISLERDSTPYCRRGENGVEVGLGGHGDLRRVVPADSWAGEGGRRGRGSRIKGDWPPSGSVAVTPAREARWGSQSEPGYCRCTRSCVLGWDGRALATVEEMKTKEGSTDIQTPVGTGHEVVQVHACHLQFLREARGQGLQGDK